MIDEGKRCSAIIAANLWYRRLFWNQDNLTQNITQKNAATLFSLILASINFRGFISRYNKKRENKDDIL